MAFGGDVHFESHVAALLRHPSTSLASLRPYLAPADIAMVNLETAITRRGTPAPKEYRFRAPASALTTLAGAGVDVVSMANNHAADYQAVGLQDTLAARRTSPVRIVGIGANAREAYSPAIMNVRGQRIAVLAASQLRDWTLQTWEATSTRPGIAGARPIAPLLEAVKSARLKADVVVVYVHWGVERMSCPDATQRDAARKLAAAGADVVIGSHPHVTQGAGREGSAYVAYSMGNFVWYSRNSSASSSTGVLTLTLDGRKVVASRWTPLRVSSSGVPKPPSSAEATRMRRDWQASRSCTGLRAIPSRTSSSEPTSSESPGSQSPSPESP
ncbi:MAG: CapA family protein [Actinomycetota bacterium]|nr:CapA family protein [Actinomycetota bacterium]